mgnify:CR=1 FL=1
MKILEYKKIEASFNEWSPIYVEVAQQVIDYISNEQFDVIHIGSTSFQVGGKGIIDLSILYKQGDLNAAIAHLLTLGFQNQISEAPFPPERPRKDGAVNLNEKKYIIHIHVIANGSNEHKKQLSYKNHMLNNPIARKEYEQSKRAILANGIMEQEAYGKQKSPYVKSILKSIV